MVAHEMRDPADTATHNGDDDDAVEEGYPNIEARNCPRFFRRF